MNHCRFSFGWVDYGTTVTESGYHMKNFCCAINIGILFRFRVLIGLQISQRRNLITELNLVGIGWGSPLLPDQSDLPRKSLRGRVARTIERVCVIAARWSIPLFLPVGFVFFVYLIGGSIAISAGLWSPSYEFLSLSDDIYLAWLGFLSGTTICIGTGSLIGLAFLTEGDGQIHNEISILASFIGFGFGAGLLRITHMTVLTSLI